MEISDRDGRDSIIPALMFTDSRKNDNNKLDKELQILYLRARNLGTHYIKFPNFCESLVFIDSNYSCGIYCADFCVGAIHKKFQNNDDTFYDLLMLAIRTNNYLLQSFLEYYRINFLFYFFTSRMFYFYFNFTIIL